MAEAGRVRQWVRGRARLLAIGLALAVAGCVAPDRGPPPPRAAVPPPPRQVFPPSATLPQDEARQRIALLVPMTGPNANVGNSIANAANLAVLDTGGTRIRVTTYDTGAGAALAAQRALADGNRLVLGPLLAADVRAVAAVTRPAGVPVVAFSNDAEVAGDGVFLMGFSPAQSIDRVVRYARSRGVTKFAGLVPAGQYGRNAAATLIRAAEAGGGQVVSMQSYERSSAALVQAVRKLGPGYEAVLIADGGRIALQAGPLLRKGHAGIRLLGTELWETDAAATASPALAGAWYASAPDAMYRQLVKKYRVRYGTGPYRLASLGYDAVLLATRVAGNWRVGAPFPMDALTDRGGFTGVDGAFRFGRNGVVERGLEVSQVGPKGPAVVSPAPTGFGD